MKKTKKQRQKEKALRQKKQTSSEPVVLEQDKKEITEEVLPKKKEKQKPKKSKKFWISLVFLCGVLFGLGYWYYIENKVDVRLTLEEGQYEFEVDGEFEGEVVLYEVDQNGGKKEGSEVLLEKGKKLSLPMTSTTRQYRIEGLDKEDVFELVDVHGDYYVGECDLTNQKHCHLEYRKPKEGNGTLVVVNDMVEDEEIVVSFDESSEAYVKKTTYTLNPNEVSKGITRGVEKVDTNFLKEEGSGVMYTSDIPVSYEVSTEEGRLLYSGTLNPEEEGKEVRLVSGTWDLESEEKRFVLDTNHLSSPIDTDVWVSLVRYHFDENGDPYTGFIDQEGTRLYYEDGEIVTGWLKQDGKTYYAREDGTLASGWKEIEDKTYYFNEKSKALLTKDSKWKGDTYYILDHNGVGHTMDEYHEVLNSFEGGKKMTTVGGYEPSQWIVDEVSNYVWGQEGAGVNVSYLILDLYTLKGVGYNLDHLYYSASSVKGFYCASLAALNPSGAASMEGTIHTILIKSDNDAYANLFLTFGNQYIKQWIQEARADVTVPSYDNYYTWYTTRNYARLWLRNFQFFTDGDYGKWIGTWYETPGMSYLHGSLMYTWPKIQSKMGYIGYNGLNSTCEGGIIYADHPYLVIYNTTRAAKEETVDWYIVNLVRIIGHFIEDI